MIQDCLVHILSFLKFNILIKFKYLNKNFHLTIELIVQTYTPKKILKSLRYSISINNFLLFKSLQHYLHKKHIFYLLRYASHKKNLTFVEHLLPYTETKLIRRCINDMISVYKNKESLYIIYKMYFFLMMTDHIEAALCNVDKMSRKICSTRSYWTSIYHSKNLELPSENYTTPEAWLISYEKELFIQFKINNLFKILSDSFESLFIGHLPFNLINFNEKINQLWNKWLLSKRQNVAAPQILIYCNDQYMINFQFNYSDKNTENYTYTVSEEYLRILFHLVLSCGVDIKSNQVSM